MGKEENVVIVSVIVGFRNLSNIWTKAGILLTGPLGTNFSEILIEITFSFIRKYFFMNNDIKFLKHRMKSTISPHKFWKPFGIVCLSYFFRLQYVCFPVHLSPISVAKGLFLARLTLFLPFITDLLSVLSLSTSCRLFTDDCLIHWSINSVSDQVVLQKDLEAPTWQRYNMGFRMQCFKM